MPELATSLAALTPVRDPDELELALADLVTRQRLRAKKLASVAPPIA